METLARALHVLIVEADAEAARILELGIGKAAPGTRVTREPGVSTEGDYRRIDVALVNHSLHDDTFSKCFLLNRQNPSIKVIVTSAPGDALRHFQQLRAQTGIIHAILEKPLSFPQLAHTLHDIARQAHSAPPSASLQRHLPAGLSLDELDKARTGDALCTEKTVLFVDIRRSTEILRRHSLDAFFDKLNRYLKHLSAIVETHRGEIIKYTGDGMLVLFGGFARRYLGFRCARALLADRASDSDFSIGLGLADGLVMIGFIGTESRLFYDVVGSNVNIAARFCAEASAGEVLMSDVIMRASGLDATSFTALRLKVKGLDEPVLCHRYQLE